MPRSVQEVWPYFHWDRLTGSFRVDLTKFTQFLQCCAHLGIFVKYYCSMSRFEDPNILRSLIKIFLKFIVLNGIIGLYYSVRRMVYLPPGHPPLCVLGMLRDFLKF